MIWEPTKIFSTPYFVGFSRQANVRHNLIMSDQKVPHVIKELVES